MTKALAIATTNLRRTFRVRTNILFIFIYPMVLILVLGVTFGGSSTPRVGVVSAGSGALGQQLLSQLERAPSLQIESIGDSATLQTGVERGNLNAGVVIPSGYDSSIRAGQPVVITYIARPDRFAQQLGETIRGVVARQSALIGAAQFAVAQGAAPNFDAGLSAASKAAPLVPAVSVVESTAGTSRFSSTVGVYDEGSWTELLLFIFLVALTGGAVGLIETRRLGLARRMLSTPTTAGTLIVGEVLGRLLVAMIQALVIIIGSALFFGVRWGQPAGVAAVVILFALASAGAGLFIGTLFRNEQQAIGVTLLLGLGLAAMGGCMVPLEIFSPTMKTVAHLTPHAWANDAFAQLVGHGASIAQIVPQLGVLAGFGVVLLSLATWRLRRVLVT